MITICYISRMQLKLFLREQSGAIISGILVGLSLLGNLPRAWLYAVGFVGYLPLWRSWLREPSARKIFIQGWITQFVLSLVGFNWVAHTLHEFTRIPWPAAIFGLLLFCSISYLYIPFAGLVWRKLFPPALPRGLRIAGLILLFAVGERIYPVIFDWNLGYAWIPLSLPAVQAADLVGLGGLSASTLILSGFLLACWLNRRGGFRAWAMPLAAVLVIYGVLSIYGYLRVLSLPIPDRIARALVVQANIGNKLRHEAEHGEGFRDAIVKQYVELSEEGIHGLRGQADFIVWPETAFPDFILPYRFKGAHFDRLKKFLNEARAPLLTGAYSFTKDAKASNSFFVLEAKDPWRGDFYEKNRLLAFGEYLPGSAWFPGLLSIVPGARNFGRGESLKLLQAGDIKIGPQICYEGLFEDVSRLVSDQGAQILVNLTNDSWYGHWQEPWQHLYMSLGRAIETRRPYLRSTNTGISSVMLANGREMERSPVGEAWVHDYDIPYREEPGATFFMSRGFWLVPAMLWLSLALVILAAQIRLRRRPN